MASVKSKVPKLRFKGFSGEWNITKLCDISDKVQEKNKNNLINETFTNSAEYGIINQRDFFNKDISNEINLCHYYVVQPNDFVYNPRISNLAPVGPIKRNKLNRTGVMSPLYYVFRTHSINNDFLDYYFSTSKWHRFMFMNGDKGARSDRFAIGDSVFRTMPILTPKQQEQTQIGHFFQKLDQVIELQQHALTQAQNYKKAMLQKMFPQKGKKVPKVRFNGFSGDWVEKKLGSLVDIYRGLTYKPENIVKNKSGIRVLRSSNINENTLVLYPDDVFVDSSAVKLNNIQIGDILITAANGSSHLVGKHAVIENELIDTVHGGFMLTLRAKVPFFVNSWMNTYEYKMMLQWVQGGNGAIGNLSKPLLEQCKITLPVHIKEQTQIGNFFQQLDKQITEQQNKLTHYQTLKKAMLQRLFI